MELKTLLGQVRDFLDLRRCDAVNPFIDGLDWNFNQRNLKPVDSAATKWLPDCQAFAGASERSLVNSVVEMATQLVWFTSYDKEAFGEHVSNNVLATELVGPQGQFMSEEVRLGFYLQGPNVVYPNHWHMAEELYIPLTSNTLWSRDNGEFVNRNSGEFIVHQSNEHHAMTTKEAPLLALWVWRGGDLRQKPEY